MLARDGPQASLLGQQIRWTYFSPVLPGFDGVYDFVSSGIYPRNRAVTASPTPLSVGYPHRVMTERDATGKSANGDGTGHCVRLRIDPGNGLVVGVGYPNRSSTYGEIGRHLSRGNPRHNNVRS